VHCKLTDISESSLVANLVHSCKTDDLSSRVLHQVDALNCVHRGLPTSFDKACIKRLETSFLDALIADDGGFPDNQKCGDPGSFIRAICRPDLDDGLEEGFEEFAEAEEVWDEFQGRVEEELLRGGVGEQREKVHQRLRVRFEEWSKGAVFLGVCCNSTVVGVRTEGKTKPDRLTPCQSRTL